MESHMIGSLRGAVIDRGATDATIEVGGVGYRVVCPSGVLGSLRVGDEVQLWIHHHVREDALTLFGFASVDERQLFESLIGTHGVGPSLALAIQSVHTPAALRLAVATEDLSALCAVPGVGKKTAQRLLIELASKLDVDDISVDVSAPPTGENAADGLSDTRDALAALGYSGEEIRRALHGLNGDDSAVLLRAALQRLATA